ncbi:Non-heme chloroperoxidase [Paenibacillus plantiphilus]|uniref:Non-heme chloroperoxidase n=1 Tax=Paenibacillus plantiphilus TaxID=2905650 RepID=A0ABN8H1F8_9BACL|nr:alpha/beta hydrolase [Paenibacillus plantiphilus]CAH1221899.1 Non-heme chloroperoxidase [Paenibacillus plantiphilus]
MMRTEAASFIYMRDGRKLAYKEYGASGGIPVMLFHGTPGSKIWYAEEDDIALSLGIRLIATDRPGFGTSDNKPGRSLLHWADDIVQLADQLGIGQFAVLGASGGGVYAAACAYAIPDRLRNVTMVASATPFVNGKPSKAMIKENRTVFWLGRHAPWLLKPALQSQRKMMLNKPDKFLDLMKKGNSHLSDWDKQYVQTDEQLNEMFIHLHEAYRVSVDGMLYETRLLTQPWGFDVEDIAIPVHLWHGEADRMAPYEDAKELADRMRHAHFHSFPGAGHFLTSDESIWTSILQTVRADFS